MFVGKMGEGGGELGLGAKKEWGRVWFWSLCIVGCEVEFVRKRGGYGGGEAGDGSNGTVEEKRVGWAFCLRMKLVSYVCAEFNSASKLLNSAVL